MLQAAYSIQRVKVKVPARRILHSARALVGDLEDELRDDRIPDLESADLLRSTGRLLSQLLERYPDDVTVLRPRDAGIS